MAVNYNPMKHTLTLILLVVAALTASAQKLTYEDTQNLEIAGAIKNNTPFTSYVGQDGLEIKLGDKLIIGRPSTNSNEYTYLYFGKVTITSMMLTPPLKLGAAYQTEVLVIDKITAYHMKTSKQSPMYIWLYAVNPNMPDMGKNRTIIGYDKAIELGEIVNPSRPMSREEAIKKLKESKDLLDLEMITQAKYDSIKAQLAPIIQKGN
jgi:hypothetical protein